MILHLYPEWIFIDASAAAQDCCQVTFHNSREQPGTLSALNPTAGHWRLVTAHLYAEWIVIGASAVEQVCSQLIFAKQPGMLSALNPAAGHWWLVSAHLYAEWPWTSKK